MWIGGQPTLGLCISNKMEACWALYNRFHTPPLHLCLSMMVNHSLGRKPDVLFMPSFELKCFSLCYINIYITPSNTVIDSARSLWEHIPCYNGNTSSRWGAAPSVQNNRHSPRPIPIPVAALGTSQGSEELYKCCHHRGALWEMPAWMSCDLSPLPTLHYWIHWEALGPAAARTQQELQGSHKATSSRTLRAGTELLLTPEGIQMILGANLTRILSHFVFTRWCSWGLSVS